MANIPFSDDYMTYDYNMHRYVLTDKAVLDLLGENLNIILNNPSPETKNALLKKISNTVYNYILTASMSPDYIEYILAMDVDLRPMIQDMLVSQVEYTLTNGAVENFSGVNISKGSYIELDKIRNGQQVSMTVVQLANNMLPKYGHSLRYACALPHVCKQFYRVGY